MFESSFSWKLDGEEIEYRIADVDHVYVSFRFIVDDIGIDLFGEVVGQIGALITHQHKPTDQSSQTYIVLAETLLLEKWLQDELVTFCNLLTLSAELGIREQVWSLLRECLLQRDKKVEILCEENTIDVLSTIQKISELLVNPCYYLFTISTHSIRTHYMLFMNIGKIIDLPRIFEQRADSSLLLEEQIKVSLFPAEDGMDNLQLWDSRHRLQGGLKRVLDEPPQNALRSRSAQTQNDLIL